MRAVHAFKLLKGKTEHTFNILVWKLSVIQNNKLGFHTVLYTTPEDRLYLESVHIIELYKEVHYINDLRLKQISLKHFWASFKFIAIEHEILAGHNDFFIQDTDLVFMDNSIITAINKANVLVWSNNEPMRVYPNIATLSKPTTFNYPVYFEARTRPVNTAIIYVKNTEILKDWLQLVWSFMLNNPINTHDLTGPMITVEQRFFPNIVKNKYNTEISFYEYVERQNFGKEHFHIWGYKHTILAVPKLTKSWVKTLLILIQKADKQVFENIVNDADYLIKSVLSSWDSITIAKQLQKYI